MKINYNAQDRLLVSAADGAVATMRMGEGTEIVGIVQNHTSEDGYTVSVFAVPTDAASMPMIVMTRDNPDLQFAILNDSIEQFYAEDARGSHFEFTRQLCEHQQHEFEAAAGLHCAFWLSRNYRNRIDDRDIPQASEITRKAREQFYDFIRMARIRPQGAAA